MTRPFAITTGGHYPRIVAANDAALAAAVAPEQLVSAAFALAPGIALRDRDSELESAALARVAAWATQFTPNVSLAPPDADPREQWFTAVEALLLDALDPDASLEELVNRLDGLGCDFASAHRNALETVRGVGYRYRPTT